MTYIQFVSRGIIFFSGAFLIAFLNLSSIASVTQNIPLLQYSINLVGLMTLSLAPLALYFDRIVDSRECSYLFVSLTAGIATGCLIFLTFSVAWRLILEPSYGPQFVPVATLWLMMVGFDALFFGVFRQIDELKTNGRIASSFDATQPRNFRGLMLYVNIIASPPIIVLVLLTNFVSGSVVALVQVMITAFALRLHKLSISRMPH